MPARSDIQERCSDIGNRAMKLYDYAPAPNPRRVRMFLAEKGIALPTVQVDLRANAQFTPEFRAINPDCTVPVLELDDGTRISDVMAICVYFEVLQPKPALMGIGPLAAPRSPHGSARSSATASLRWRRRCATRLPPSRGGHCRVPRTTSRFLRSLNAGEPGSGKFFHKLDTRLAAHEFVAGDAFSIADITALVAVDFARWISFIIRVIPLPAPLARGRIGAPQRQGVRGSTGVTRLDRAILRH